MSEDQKTQLEQLVNQKICAGLRMYPTLYSGVDDPALKEVRNEISFLFN